MENKLITPKTVLICLLSAWIFTLSIGTCSATLSSSYPESPLTNRFQADYENFLSPNRMARLGFTFSVGSVLANSDIDNSIRRWVQTDRRSAQSDKVAASAKQLGEGKYLIPLAILAAGTSVLPQFVPGSTYVSTWGEHTSRAYLVGGMPLLLMQRVSGASRPGETEDNSNWNPMNDSNGVSGHTFVGAVPFLTLARMHSNSPAKYLFYGASALAGWSRINDDAHYTSQVLLGWFMAWEATGAVFNVDNENQNIHIKPVVTEDGGGIMFEWQW